MATKKFLPGRFGFSTPVATGELTDPSRESIETMRLPNIEAVHRLVNQRMPETQTLDFKRELSLRSTPNRRSTQKGRRELLKDVSGMGNGGGGTIVFGIDEDEGIAEAVTPLTDVGLVGVLHDVVRDGIRPPLLYEYALYDCETGYVLVVDVEP